MVCIVFHVCVVSEVVPALSSSLIRGGPPCPCVVKKYVYDPELIPLSRGRGSVRPGWRELRKLHLYGGGKTTAMNE